MGYNISPGCCCERGYLNNLRYILLLLTKLKYRDVVIWDPFYLHGLTFILERICDHIPSKTWHKPTYPFSNIKCAAVEALE